VIITRNASFLLSPGRERMIGLVLMKKFFFKSLDCGKYWNCRYWFLKEKICPSLLDCEL
jgi:hypothetical protein